MQKDSPDSTTPSKGPRRLLGACLLLVLLLLASVSRAGPTLDFSAGATVPSPREQRCDVLFSCRTAEPAPDGRISVRRIDDPDVVPDTYSNGLVGNSEGFRWYVSSHFALKTDLDDGGATDALVLLETAWPLYEALFDATPWRCGRGPRIALVLASSREALGRAIVDDDMHVFHLGGITQEGFAAAYLYAGAPYQTRYILLHETTHLFQYCLNGNTRGCYGFFVEGIADFFSSHVYDTTTGRLTVNVLDRAPIHNHLLAGLEKWEELGEPSFSTLYGRGEICRGLNVLLTAFLQSTPEYEQLWSLYLRGVVANREADKAKEISDRLLLELYGGAEALDKPFREWLRKLAPSYQIFSRDFDQDGEALVSGFPASEEEPARIFLPPSGAAGGPFTRDWPSPGDDDTASATTLFQTTVQSRTPPPPGSRAGIALCDPEGGLLLRCELVAGSDDGPVSAIRDGNGTTCVVFPMGPSSWTNGTTVDFSRTLDPRKPVDLLVTTSDAGPRAIDVSFAPATAGRLVSSPLLRPQLFATAPAIRFTPRRGPAAGLPSLSPDHRLVPSRKAVLGRFGTSAALSRIYRAIRSLGDDAPLPLRLARNDLLARGRGSEGLLVTDEVLEAPSYWESLVKAVVRSRAPAEAKTAALIDLAGLRLDCGPSPGAMEVSLSAAPPYPDSIRIDWRDGDGDESLTRRVTGGETTITLPGPPPGSGPVDIRATIEWLGQELPLSIRPVTGGAIPSWHILGPFRIPGGTFTNGTVLPEAGGIDLQRTYERDDGSRIAWQACRLPDDASRCALRATSLPYHRGRWRTTPLVPARETLPPVLHFTRLFFRQANDSIAYAAILVDSPSEQEALLSLGVTDGVEIRQNGHPVYLDIRTREWAEGNIRLPVRLVRGRNEFLLKLVHHENVWFLSGSLLGRDGTPLEGLVYH